MEHLKENLEKNKCKKCGCDVYTPYGVKAGYCAGCANKYEEARNAWKEAGFTNFCSVCGLMLHAQESIDEGKCSICRFKMNMF